MAAFCASGRGKDGQYRPKRRANMVMTDTMNNDSSDDSSAHDKSIVLVGLMGAGKTSVGQRLAGLMGRPFVDADHEIEVAAGCSVQDIFDLYGEEAFRDCERKVIARILDEGPVVLATGGGAFMDPASRDAIANKGISVWIRADLETLVRRTGRKAGRPLLKGRNPAEVLEKLMSERDPVYTLADITVDTSHESPDITAQKIADRLGRPS